MQVVVWWDNKTFLTVLLECFYCLAEGSNNTAKKHYSSCTLYIDMMMYIGNIYGKPGMPEQPRSVLFLWLESHANTSMPDYIKMPQWNEQNLSANKLYNAAIILTCNKSAGYTTN